MNDRVRYVLAQLEERNRTDVDLYQWSKANSPIIGTAGIGNPKGLEVGLRYQENMRRLPELERVVTMMEKDLVTFLFPVEHYARVQGVRVRVAEEKARIRELYVDSIPLKEKAAYLEAADRARVVDPALKGHPEKIYDQLVAEVPVHVLIPNPAGHDWREDVINNPEQLLEMDDQPALWGSRYATVVVGPSESDRDGGF